MKKISAKKVLLTVVIAVLAANSLLITPISAATNQELSASINNYIDKAEAAAKADLLFAALDYCLGEKGVSSSVFDFKTGASGEKFVTNFPLNGDNFDDSWIEVIVDGGTLEADNGNDPPAKHDDNRIDCNEASNNIIPALAAAIGKSSLDILCHHANNDRRGIAARYTTETKGFTTYYTPQELGCNDYGDQNRHFSIKPDGFSRRYLSELYLWYRTQNEYANLITNGNQVLADAWKESNGNISWGEKYYYYLYNFYSACGQNEISEQAAKDYASGKSFQLNLVEISEDKSSAVANTKYFKTYREQELSKRYGKFSLINGVGESSDTQCTDLVDKINSSGIELAKDINKKILEFKVNDCVALFDAQTSNMAKYQRGYNTIVYASNLYIEGLNEIVSLLDSGGDIGPKVIYLVEELTPVFASGISLDFDTEYATYGETLSTIRTNQLTGIGNINATLGQLVTDPSSATQKTNLTTQKTTFENDTKKISDNKTKLEEAINKNSNRNKTSPGSGDGYVYNYNSSDYSNFTCQGVEGYEEPELDLSGVDTGVSDPSVADTNPSCFDGAGSLGWILCPATEGMVEASDGIYGAIQGLLNLDANLLTSDNMQDNATYLTWTYFRDIANVLFIILFLVIIFSQITGVGIDNYGIKKVLPKLVITAILVNLSYFVCQLAVDISNILGSSLDNFLGSIGQTVIARAGRSGGDWAEFGFGVILTAIIAIAGAAVGVGSVAMTIGSTAMTIGAGGFGGLSLFILLVPLILMLIVALVAVIMFFVSIALRNLLVILFVAISPLAFVCYALPNTNPLFKKWWTVMKGLLLVYPICGALYGFSQIIKALAYTADGMHIFMVMIAMLSTFLPFLLLPTLIKKSMTAVGNIGAALSGITSRVRGAGREGQRRFAESGINKTYQRKAAISRAGRISQGKGRFNGFLNKHLPDYATDRQRSATATVNAEDARITKEYSDQFAGLGTGEEIADHLDTALASGNSNMAAAAISNLAARGDFNEITNRFKKLTPDAYQKLMSDAKMRDTISNSFATHKKDAAHLWSWGIDMKKNGANTQSLTDFAKSGAMQRALSSQGDDLASSQDRDSLKAMNSLMEGTNQQLFSERQLRNGAIGADSQESREAISSMMEKSEDGGKSIIAGMNAAQIAKLKPGIVSDENLKQWVSEDAMNSLRDPQNASLLASMNPSVKATLFNQRSQSEQQPQSQTPSAPNRIDVPRDNNESPPVPPPAPNS